MTKPPYDLFAGIEALDNPDYHALNAANQRLLHAVMCAYSKHVLDRDEIGWGQLENILHNALCEAMGDEEYIEWMEKMSQE